MALPSATIGYAPFEGIIASQRDRLNGANALSQSYVGLGKEIASGIENRAYQKQAASMLPTIQSQYQQGFTQLDQGDISGGLGTIYGASLQAMQNPLLAPIGNQVNMTAGYMANNAFKARQAPIDAALQLQNQKDYYDYRQENPTGPTFAQKLSGINAFTKKAEAIQKSIDENASPEMIATQARSAMELYNTMQGANAGLDVNLIAEPIRQKVESNKRKMDELQAQGNYDMAKWSGLFREAKELSDTYAKALRITARREEGIVGQGDISMPEGDLPQPDVLTPDPLISEPPATPRQSTIGAVSQIPTLTSREQFDALPSGAQYLRDGKLYRKP